jgi:MoaA/NifB/PqqE/SkfB family radical SAM enzyme
MPATASPQHYVHWHMLTECNFDCQYCFRQHSARHPAPERTTFSPETISSAFDGTGRQWHIYMTGGEPLLYPRFVEIATALTRKHRISLATNLSTSNVLEFADSIDPAMVGFIDVSLHLLERERRHESIDELVHRIIHFQYRRFSIRISYVAWPPLLGRMASDFARFRDAGITSIVARPFQGRHEARRYPRDYTPAQMDMLRQLGMGASDGLLLDGNVSLLGRKCLAGFTSFTMDAAGDVRRCPSLDDAHGNFFDGSFRPNPCLTRCTVRKCGCLYQGAKFASGSPFAMPPHILATPATFLLSACNRLACRFAHP